jgi:sulfatase modifying factor 1
MPQLDPGPEEPSASWRAELALPASSDSGSCPEGELWVPGGAFLMGSVSDQAGQDEGPVEVVQVSGFCLDRLEVDAGSFARFSGESAPAQAGLPADAVEHAQAQAYCRAQGKRLPTEAEWEKAARGGCELGQDPARCDVGDLRPYPWGEAAPSCGLANHQSTASGRPSLCTSGPVQVDSMPEGAGPYGHLHLAGNVWELVADSYHPAVYGSGRSDPGGPEGGEVHSLRGGSWNTFSTNMRVANRFSDLVLGSATGFRCARSEAQPTPDPVEPLQLVTVSGTLERESGPMQGRAAYVTAFSWSDVDADSQMAAPGRSPAAELKLVPTGGRELAFELRLPAGTYAISGSLDDGSMGEEYGPASGSGGMGLAQQNPVEASEDVSGLRITLRSMPAPPPH